MARHKRRTLLFEIDMMRAGDKQGRLSARRVQVAALLVIAATLLCSCGVAECDESAPAATMKVVLANEASAPAAKAIAAYGHARNLEVVMGNIGLDTDRFSVRIYGPNFVIEGDDPWRPGEYLVGIHRIRQVGRGAPTVQELEAVLNAIKEEISKAGLVAQYPETKLPVTQPNFERTCVTPLSNVFWR